MPSRAVESRGLQSEQAPAAAISRAADAPAVVHLRGLQQRYGNGAVARSLRYVQPKLTVTPANDASEREADEVARLVMRSMHRGGGQAAQIERTEAGRPRVQASRTTGRQQEQETKDSRSPGQIYRDCAKKGKELWQKHLSQITVATSGDAQPFLFPSLSFSEERYNARYDTYIDDATAPEGYMVTTIPKGTVNEPYVNTFSLDLSRIVKAENDRDEDRTAREEALGIPRRKSDALFNNEIFYNQHRVLLHALGQTRTPGVLTSIDRTGISNPVTRAVVWLVHPSSERSAPKQWPRDHRPDDDFYALLGTPNVSPALLLLIDQPTLGNTIAGIETVHYPEGEFIKSVRIDFTGIGKGSSPGEREAKTAPKTGDLKDTEHKAGSTERPKLDPRLNKPKTLPVVTYVPAEPARGWWQEPETKSGSQAPAERKADGQMNTMGAITSTSGVGEAEAAESEARKKRLKVMMGLRASTKPADAHGASEEREQAAPMLEDGIAAARGTGTPLHTGVRTAMERAIGADFSNVRVHTTAGADSMNRAIDARAFTTGADIFFRHGEYQPAAHGGQELLAHELTHVIQQGAAHRDGATRVQAKGKKSGESQSDYEKRVYAESLQRGRKLWTELTNAVRKEHRFPSLSFTQDRFEERYESKVEQSETVPDALAVTTRVKDGGHKVYVNTFSAGGTKMLNAHNYRDEDWTDSEKKARDEQKESKNTEEGGPGAMFNNEIIFHQHRLVLEHLKSHRPAGTLESVKRGHVINAEAKIVVKRVHTTDNFDEKVWRHTDPDPDPFYALLGTPNLRPAAFLLIQQPTLGKVIDKIVTLRRDRDFDSMISMRADFAGGSGMSMAGGPAPAGVESKPGS